MNPFANPEDAVAYEYVEFPKQETNTFQFMDFAKDLSQEVSASTNRFVDFLNLKDLPEEKTTSVQLAIFQNFKDVIPSEG
ncbi:MAG TPA: hypothetical protein VK791_03065 [bacterium]|jgi:hypothetical protein|nr:hypothetical protein [bacterium]